MEQGLIAAALTRPLVAGAVGAAVSLASAWSGWRVAGWLHAAGLRDAPPPLSWGLGTALLWGLVAAALAASGLSHAGVSLVLAALWGHLLCDLANNVRAAAALQAVSRDPADLAVWRQLSTRSRLGVALATGPALTVLVAALALLRLDPVSLGLLAGVLSHVAWQRHVAGGVVAGTLRSLAEDLAAPGPPADSEPNRNGPPD